MVYQEITSLINTIAVERIFLINNQIVLLIPQKLGLILLSPSIVQSLLHSEVKQYYYVAIKEVPKQATPEQLEQYKQDKEQNRMKNQVIIDRIAAQISEFKTHFYAACFEQTFDRILAGDVPAPFKVETRENEFICVVPDSTNIRN